MLNLPNFLTLARILSIPFFLVALAYQKFPVALMIFVFGALTDYLDGLTARWMNQQTAVGAYLDPAADKLLVFSSYGMLGFIGGIPLWLVVLVIMRDVFIVFGFAVIYFVVDEKYQASPTLLGKWCTAFQLLTLAGALLALQAPALLPPILSGALTAATAAATVASGTQYLYRGLVWMQNHASSIGPPS